MIKSLKSNVITSEPHFFSCEMKGINSKHAFDSTKPQNISCQCLFVFLSHKPSLSLSDILLKINIISKVVSGSNAIRLLTS